MEYGTDGSLECESAAADEDAERRDKRPEEAFPSVPQWVGLIRRPARC